MSVEVVRFAEIAPTRWKNGLGTTTQLAMRACADDSSAFEWRVSIASLTGTAPFSFFADVERSLAMLEGEVTLHRTGHPSVTLTPASSPFTFSGSEAITGCVETGRARDLNLMYRPLRWRASMRRITLSKGESILTGDMTMLCALSPVQLDAAGERIELRQFDLLCASGPRLELTALTELAGYAIELQEHDA